MTAQQANIADQFQRLVHSNGGWGKANLRSIYRTLEGHGFSRETVTKAVLAAGLEAQE